MAAITVISNAHLFYECDREFFPLSSMYLHLTGHERSVWPIEDGGS